MKDARSAKAQLTEWKQAVRDAEDAFNIEFTAERRRWNDATAQFRESVLSGGARPSVDAGAEYGRFQTKYAELARLVDEHGVHTGHPGVAKLSIELIGHPPSPI